MRLRWWLAPAAAVARHPQLWATAFRQVGRLAAPGWWQRPPFLPLPSAAYLRFRLETAYGEQRPPAPEDLLTFLRWCKRSQ
jgi:hypothetical protein